jgi:hypothetical protein
MFERGNAISAHNDATKSVQSDRQKELEMLLNRWNKNKQLASSGDCKVNVEPAVLDTQKKQVILSGFSTLLNFPIFVTCY